MDRSEFNVFLDRQWNRIRGLNTSKGHDYAGDENVFANFDRAAEKFDLSRETVLGVYLSKHLDAIDTFIKEGDVESEPIEGRIHDAILYLLLLLAMISPQSKRVRGAVQMVPVPAEMLRGDPDGRSAFPLEKTAS